MSSIPIRLVLYGRGYCHLCDDMRDALEPFRATFRFDLELVDVDADPALVARYDELVPVLVAVHADGARRELCHYHLDADTVRAAFMGTPPQTS